MSRPKRILRKRFEVFCEGDTEYHYIDHMRKNQGVEISLQPINMRGGGYRSFLEKIKEKSQTNCIAKFIIVDADRISNSEEEKAGFLELVEYCQIKNLRKAAPHFLIVDNPDFEYAACLHFTEYKGQATDSYITRELGFSSVDKFKSREDIYALLNSAENGYKNLLERIAGKPKLLYNTYKVRRKSFDVEIEKTVLDFDNFTRRGSNLDEFFDVIDW